jgi:hypothetical protein
MEWQITNRHQQLRLLLLPIYCLTVSGSRAVALHRVPILRIVKQRTSEATGYRLSVVVQFG